MALPKEDLETIRREVEYGARTSLASGRVTYTALREAVERGLSKRVNRTQLWELEVEKITDDGWQAIEYNRARLNGTTIVRPQLKVVDGKRTTISSKFRAMTAEQMGVLRTELESTGDGTVIKSIFRRWDARRVYILIPHGSISEILFSELLNPTTATVRALEAQATRYAELSGFFRTLVRALKG